MKGKINDQITYRLGREISKQGKILTTGATVGLPHYAAIGAVSVKGRTGLSVGFSPASSFRQHVNTYKLPFKPFDYINFTGMNYVGRDTHLVLSSDAVITVGGRMGSLHELATALEARKVVAVLTGSKGLADYTKTLLENVEAPNSKDVIFDSNPERLVQKVIKRLDEKNRDFIAPEDDSHLTVRRSGNG